MAWWQWSRTAGTNSNADPTIGWAEGMSPSSVNDSARAQMARTADYRDLISGKLVTTGTGTALVLASLQTPAFDTIAHMDGQMLAFVPHATNTGPVTLAVDGLTAKPIRSQTGSAGDLGAGVLVVGTPYVVTYYNAVGEFILQGIAGQPFAVPIGSLLFYTGGVTPNSNFIFPIGQAISRTTYANYFSVIQTYYGAGNGTTTFNVPDLRSRFLLPQATMGGSDPGRVTTAGSGIDGATIAAVGGAENITLDATMVPSHTHTFAGNALAGHTHGVTITQGAVAGGGGVLVFAAGGSSPTGSGITVSSDSAGTPTGTNSNTGGGLNHNNMPPTFVLPIILRVL